MLTIHIHIQEKTFLNPYEVSQGETNGVLTTELTKNRLE